LPINGVGKLLHPKHVKRNDENSKELIGQELEAILSSESFRGSKRCQAFLKYVVEAAATGAADQLKERTVGIEVFGRDPSYDTGDDAIVRVKANEVRKRLAQYSITANPDRRIRIELPPGSYVPQFGFSNFAAPDSSVFADRSSRWRLIGFAAMLTACAVAVYSIGLPQNSLKLFWGPVTKGASLPIICLGHPDLYVATQGASSPVVQRSSARQISSPEQKSGIPPLGTGVVLMRNRYVGIGDSDAAFLIGRTLQSLGSGSQARLGSDVTYSDLKKSPAILVGGFSNRWTMSMTSGLRFSFAEQNGTRVIVDRNKPSVVWQVPSLSKTGSATEDYAIVSRLVSSPTGQVLISAAGINSYGSQAAGEFITDPSAMKKLESTAPRGWEQMNMQVILRTRVIGETPTPAEVVATYYWR
jgi:hypothetical protein